MNSYYLDDSAYSELLNLLNNQHFTEITGQQKDMTFLSDDWWLRDTAVNEYIVGRRGMWEIHLVFAHFQQPLKLIKRVISSCPQKQKAELHAHYMRRQAAKDQRGTLKVNLQDFGLCQN